MDLSVRLRRLGYRLASRLLGLGWVLFHVRHDGVKCVITDGDRLLLVRHTYGSGAWDLPGGAHRRGEPPSHTAAREMAEELGLELDPLAWRDLGEMHSVRGSHRVRVLAAEVPAPPLRLDPVELEAAAWFARDRLPWWRGPLLTPILEAVAPPDGWGAAPAGTSGAGMERDRPASSPS